MFVEIMITLSSCIGLTILFTMIFMGSAQFLWSRKPQIKFILTSDKATPPERGTLKSAGFDLKSSEDSIVPPRSRKAIKINVKVTLPPNTYGRIASRSGLSFKHGIEVGAGVVDEDYQNDLMVILHNHSDDEFVVKEKDRIAQFIVEPVVYPTTLIEDIDGSIQTINGCIRTIRGLGGFGSTGTN